MRKLFLFALLLVPRLACAQQTTLDTDNFTPGTTGANLTAYNAKWVLSGTSDCNNLTIQSAPGVGSGSSACDYDNAAALSGINDQFGQLTVTTAPNQQWFITLRTTTPSNLFNAYVCGINPQGVNSTYRIGKYVNNVFTSLATGTHTMSAADVVNCQVTGSSPPVIKLLVNGSPEVSFTDNSNTFTTGNPGIYFGNSTVIKMGTSWSAGSAKNNTANTLLTLGIK